MLSELDNKPGITCPNRECNQKFSVSLQDFLYQISLKCPHCLLELTLDRDKSRETIKAASDLEAAIRNAEKSKKFK